MAAAGLHSSDINEMRPKRFEANPGKLLDTLRGTIGRTRLQGEIEVNPDQFYTEDEVATVATCATLSTKNSHYTLTRLNGNTLEWRRTTATVSFAKCFDVISISQQASRAQ